MFVACLAICGPSLSDVCTRFVCCDLSPSDVCSRVGIVCMVCLLQMFVAAKVGIQWSVFFGFLEQRQQAICDLLSYAGMPSEITNHILRWESVDPVLQCPKN